ncbi:MAG: glycosyltransferase family 4 protein [Candidatus Bathyarchaeota archaeon]|nr:glycosyltransferase family 4 protein [Candidatus Bathyarchaeota archaeon]
MGDTGPTVRIYHLAKSLASLGHEVDILIPGNNPACKHIDGMTVHYINGACPQIILKILSKILGVSRSTSLFFYDVGFILKVSRMVLKFDIVQIEEQEGGGLLIPIISKILKKTIVVDCHDVFQTLRIKHTGTIRRILGTFLEKIAYKYSSAILTVSEKERELLVFYGIEKRKIHIIPNGVDTEAFNPSIEKSRVKDRFDLRHSRTVIFVGNMEYLPNREALQVIASEIAPRVQKEISGTKFLIVGRTPAEVECHNLIFTGVVENVAELLATSDVAIAPLSHGSGTRLKILEYFSCGLPVVSTSVGVEGLDVKSGVHALIRDNVDKFAIEVIKLLKDRALAIRLGKAARELVVNNYDWKKIVRHQTRVYHNLLLGINNKPRFGDKL